MTAIKIGEKTLKLIEQLPQGLIHEVFPKVVRKAVSPMKESIRVLLPDGDQPLPGSSDGRPSREKQTEAVRQRFPDKLKNSVTHKTITDANGMLLIVGVSTEAGHVNFDFGNKAKKVGRIHKLWWVDGVREVYHSPKYRKQTQDISTVVTAQFKNRIGDIIAEELSQYIRKQM